MHPSPLHRAARALLSLLALSSLAVGCQQMDQPEPPPGPTGTAQVMFVNLALYGGDAAYIERPGFQGSGAVYAEALPRGQATGYHAVPAGSRTHVEAFGVQTEFHFEPDRRYVVTLAGRAELHVTARELDLSMGDPGAAYLRFSGLSGGDYAGNTEIFGTAVPFSGQGIDPEGFQPVTAGEGTLRTAPSPDGAPMEMVATLNGGEFYGWIMYEERVGDSRAETAPAMTLISYGRGE